jgi:hypothetical protein
MNPIDSSKSFKLLKIWFESSTVALTIVATFGAAVRATALAVEVEVKDRH